MDKQWVEARLRTLPSWLKQRLAVEPGVAIVQEDDVMMWRTILLVDDWEVHGQGQRGRIWRI